MAKLALASMLTDKDMVRLNSGEDGTSPVFLDALIQLERRLEDHRKEREAEARQIALTLPRSLVPYMPNRKVQAERILTDVIRQPRA